MAFEVAQPEVVQPAEGWRAWVRDHDEKRLFTVLYIGLAVLLSVLVSLFWLVALLAAHAALQVARERALGKRWGPVAGEVLWHVKLDLALVLFSFALALYLGQVMGVLGLAAASRAGAAVQTGARAAARVGAWERAIRGVLLSLDDMAQVGRAAAAGRKRAKREAAAHEGPPWAARWGLGDRVAIALGVLCLLLVLTAPWVLAQPAAEVVATLAQELQPWPQA